ncbi:alpha-1,2-fucosyltransferase [Parabacteroides sp. OttesenSCG-928-O15]|nr:alpha-1,2-fucosyltransferase [Parabacteroides sp. OttesenSCG-928-O15]
MEIVLLIGGLGNQMSQFAFHLAKQQYSKSIFNSYFIRRNKEHQGYELERIFHIADNKNMIIDFFVRFIRKILYTKEKKYIGVFSQICSIVLKKIRVNVIFENKSYNYDEGLLKKKSGINVYMGGWHSEKYYKDIKEEIRGKFSFDESLISTETQRIKSIIEKTDSVSIHIRRGDYLIGRNKEVFGDICSIDYYYRAILYIKERIPSPMFFIFSNDMKWVKENLLLENVFYVDCNRGNNSWQDMFLMSKCQHNINANSTFSWWGAWLNSNPDKLVITPQSFMRNVETPDIYPDSWIKL